MHIYLSTSITGGSTYGDIVYDVLAYVAKYGKIINDDILNFDEIQKSMFTIPAVQVADETFGRLEKADIIIAEVSTPSLGVGYELARASDRKIPIHALWYTAATKKLSPFIEGNRDIEVYRYGNLQEAQQYIDTIFSD